MTIARLPIPGTAAFAAVTRDVADAMTRVSPSFAADSGLFEDAVQVPSFTPAAVASLVARLDRDMARMRAMPWRTWNVDRQIDFRYIYAQAELTRDQLVRQRLFVHRPAEYLEPVGNVLVDIISFVPSRYDLMARVMAQVPAMLAEMRTVVSAPTQRDVGTAREITGAFIGMCAPPKSVATAATGYVAFRSACARAVPALRSYDAYLARLHNLPPYRVIGAQDYAFILKRGELLPYTPAQLRAFAQKELARVDAEMAALKPQVEPTPAPTDAQIAEAQALTKDKLLALYDAIEVDHLQKLKAANVVTVPPYVGTIHAREMPDAAVPITGDGGSMNPPPTYVTDSNGYWNVEHFHANWSKAKRLDEVLDAENFRTGTMGPYSAHEGWPGHFLQLSIARKNPDPIRSVFGDGVATEGWALYAEEMFWRAGGLGDSVAVRYNTLRSWRARVRRVIYDVNVETGAWTLQQAADWKRSVAPGTAKIDGDLLRTINWPAQLICYFTGKMQIEALKADYKKKMGARYSERAFHDALLSVGSVPLVLARAKLLGEKVPDL